MGIWIELGIFVLVFVWAAWQFHDLKQERLKRERRAAQEGAGAAPPPSGEDRGRP